VRGSPDGHLANLYGEACPSRQALDRLADKWTVLLIGQLETGPKRFGQPVAAVRAWAEQHINDVEAARVSYERRPAHAGDAAR